MITQPNTTWLKLALFLLGLGVVIWVVVYFLTTGQLTITGRDPSIKTIITRLDGHPLIKSLNGKASLRLPNGRYSLVVTGRSTNWSQTVTLTSKGLTLTVPTLAPGVVVPVSDLAASDLWAAPDGLSFLDTNSNILYHVNQANQLQVIDSTHGFTIVNWANASYGVAEDRYHQLYAVTPGGITPISLPFGSGVTALTYALAPNGSLYVSDGQTVYRADRGAPLQRLYGQGKPVTVDSAGNDVVLVTETDSTTRANSQLAITPSGQIHRLAGDIYESSWSPDSRHVVISSDGSTAVYDQNLVKQTTLPTSNIMSPVWLDNATILYSDQSSLWSYHLATHSGTVLADVRSIGYVGQITPSTDGAYAYFLIRNTQTNVFTLSRVALAGQPSTTIDTQLQIILPYTIGTCQIGYLNFSRLTVVVRGPAAQQTSCVQQAQNFLSTYQINLTNLPLTFTPTIGL